MCQCFIAGRSGRAAVLLRQEFSKHLAHRFFVVNDEDGPIGFVLKEILHRYLATVARLLIQGGGHGIEVFSFWNVSGLETSTTASGIKHSRAAAILLFVCCSSWAFVLQAQPDSCLIFLAVLPNLPWGRDEKPPQPANQIVYRPSRPVLPTLLRTTCLAGTRDHS